MFKLYHSNQSPNALPYFIRFEKRIYVQLPGEEERTALFRLHMAGTTHFLTEDDFSTLGKATDGYSSADINVLVRQALMLPIRKIENATYFKRVWVTMVT